MTAIIKTISLTKAQEEFLEEHPEYSLSKICQDSIKELMEMSQITGKQLQEEIRKREKWQKLCESARIFLEKHGLQDVWLKEQGY